MLHTRRPILRVFRIIPGCCVWWDIFRSITIVLGVNILLAMAKDICGHCSIAISKVLFRFISRSIVLQLWGLFQEHLSPHQFGVLTFGGCEAIIFDIQALFDLHPNWAMMQVDVENIFNNVFLVVIFRELCDVRGLW